MVTTEIIIYESYLDRSVASCYLFDQRPDVREQRSDDRGQNTENRKQRAADGDQRSEVRG